LEDIVIFMLMSLINEGLQYRLLIDPFLDRVHNMAASMIEPGSKVFDVACGNGTMALKMADQAKHVTGIDLSEASIKFANNRAVKLNLNNAEFRVKDAMELSASSDPIYDIATISMAIHQFSPETGLHILKQLNKIAHSVLVIDYAYPQPENFYGSLVRIIERIAGKEHFAHFNAYINGGGMPGIIQRMRLPALKAFLSESRVFAITKIK